MDWGERDRLQPTGCRVLVGRASGAPSLTLVSSSLCLQQELIYCPQPNEDPLHGRLPPSPVQCSFPGVILIPEDTRCFYSPAAAGTLQGTSLAERKSITVQGTIVVAKIFSALQQQLHSVVMVLQQNLNGTKQRFVVTLHSLNTCLMGACTAKCFIVLSQKLELVSAPVQFCPMNI